MLILNPRSSGHRGAEKPDLSAKDLAAAARRVARIVSADAALMAPEITDDPTVFVIWNGSPVRYDSSIEP